MMELLDSYLSNEEETVKIHPEFRVWMSCEPREGFPLGLLQRSVKVTNEPPKGVKQGLLRTYKTVVTPEFLDKIENMIWRKLVFTLSFMHSVVQERRKFGPLGWCIPYEFNYSDLEASLKFVEDYLGKLDQGAGSNATLPVSFDVIRYMVCEIQYGGKITDNLDRELFSAYGEYFIKDSLNAGNEYKLGEVNQEGNKSKFSYMLPQGEHAQIVKAIEEYPSQDNPEVFKLHPNADITCRLKETREMIETVMETRPKEGGGGGGESREDKVMAIAKGQLPLITYSYPKKKIDRMVPNLSGPKNYPIREKGMGHKIPLNIFLMQELQRMEIVINIVKKTFTDIIAAIKGQIIMTPLIVSAIDALYDMKIPENWLYDSAMTEISWQKPTFASWIKSFRDRNEMLEDWLNGSRPKMFNLDLFFNPQGFLTSVKQEVVRIKKSRSKGGKDGREGKEMWAMNNIDFKITVQKSKDIKDIDPKKSQNEGVYIYGLMIEGADIDKEGLREATGKSMIYRMPIVHITADPAS